MQGAAVLLIGTIIAFPFVLVLWIAEVIPGTVALVLAVLLVVLLVRCFRTMQKRPDL